MQDAILQGNLFIVSQAFVTLFAIFDPVGALPLLFSITGNLSEKERRRMVGRSCLIALVVLLVFAYLGVYLFRLLGITLADFRIVSGIILLIFAVDYVLGRGAERILVSKSVEELAVFPIATPLLAGPGSISVVMLMVNPPYGPVTAATVIILNVLVAWVVLYLSSRLHRLLGPQGSSVISRIMGLIIGALAVMFIREGMTEIILQTSPRLGAP